MRVATFALSNQMLQASLTTQARMSQAQLQEASGLVSTDYGGLGGDAGTVIDLETSLSRLSSYSDAATTAVNRIEVMYDVMSSVTDLLASFRSTLSSASLDTDADTVATTAQSALDELVSLLNTQYNGRTLFSGSHTDSPAVDLDGLTYDLSTLETAQTGYYQGDDRTSSVRVSSSQVVTYGVTADSDGIETAIRVLASFATATSDTLTDDAVATGMALISDAVDDILVSQTGLSLDASTLEGAIERNESTITLANEMVSDIAETDIAEVAVRISAYETQLEASYAALAKIQSVNLLDYLR